MSAGIHQNTWLTHHSRLFLLVSGLLWLVVAYLFASVAIDRGALWAYAAAVFFLLLGVQRFIALGRIITGGKTQPTKRDRTN